MVKTPIDMGLVFKRNLCMMDGRKGNNSGYAMYESAINHIRNDHPEYITKQTINKLFSEAAKKENAGKYYDKCISIMSALYESDQYDLLEETASSFLQNVMMYCPDTYAVVESAKKANIGQPVTDKIIELHEQVKICDRILGNHNKLAKRFKIDGVFKSKYMPVDEAARAICEMVDTYSIKPNIKMELCFEEMKYLSDSYNMNFNEQDMVKAISDYFLSLPLDETSVERYARCIQESKVLSNTADRKVKYITEPNKKKSILEQSSFGYSATVFQEEYADDQVESLMNNYKTDARKSDGKLRSIINKIFTLPPNKIIDETPDLLKWVRNFFVLVSASAHPIAGVITLIGNSFAQLHLRRKETERIIKYFQAEKDKVDNMLYDTSDSDKEEKLQAYSDALEKCLDKLREYSDTLYTDSELENQDDDDLIESSYIFSEAMTKVVLNNLLADAANADKLIERLEKDTLNKMNIDRTDVKDTVTTESVINYIDPDGRASFTLASYDIRKSHADLSSIYETVDVVIKSANNMLFDKKGKVYYTMIEGGFDIVFRSKFKLITTLHEDEQIAHAMTDSQKIRSGFIMESAILMEQLEALHPDSIIEEALGKVHRMDHEQATTFVSAWRYGAPIEREQMGKFVTEYAKCQDEEGNYINSFEINKLFKSIAFNEYASIYEVVESTSIMRDAIDEAVNLNSLKLAWMSFKKSMKGMSAKEQQFSRNLDMSVNNLVRGVNNFYKVTDHREQIIKGQVAPSFSKIMKIGISLAGLGVATGSFVVPIIAAIGGLAMSKNASNKEKKMIIDEIDIELKVLEREIDQIKDQPRNSKKYRILLTYQKNLQREKQRITYGLERKGIPVIKSTAGFKGGDD